MNLNNIKVNEFMAKFIKENNLILITTSYKNGQVILITTDNKGVIRVNAFTENRPMCIHTSKKYNQLIITNNNYIKSYMIQKLNNDGDIKLELTNSYFTSDIDVHDIFIKDNEIYFCSALLNGVCKITKGDKPLAVVWKPYFITESVVEDRCHLNGVSYTNEVVIKQEPKNTKIKEKSISTTNLLELAEKAGSNKTLRATKSSEYTSSEASSSEASSSSDKDLQLCNDDTEEHIYATCVSKSNMYQGWKYNKKGRGIIIDVKNNKDLIDGLSMPHSPRKYNDRLFFLNSGKGDVCVYDFKTKKVEVLASVKGFIRGLSIVKDKNTKIYGLITCSKDRHEECFRGLELEDIITDYNTVKCGLYLIDLNKKPIKNNRILGHIVFEDLVELYDVNTY